MVNPSALKHVLCASIYSTQFSRPFVTTQLSLTSLVSGQLQQIFFPDLPTGGGHDSYDKNGVLSHQNGEIYCSNVLYAI